MLRRSSRLLAASLFLAAALSGFFQPTRTLGAPLTVTETLKQALAARGVPLSFTDPIAGPAAIAAAGYVPSHGWVGFKGEGVAFGRPPSDAPFVLTDPPVLLYRAVPSGSFSDAQLSDQRPEPGYELAGVAYFTDYHGTTPIEETPPENPPTLDPIPNGLLPTGAWFRHTAGCHMSSGEFVAFSENLPAPSLATPDRLAQGVAWCQDIGINSQWVADGDVELSASGRCLLDRDLNPLVGLPRPVRPNSFVRLSAPDSYLPRPADPPSPPAVVADPGPPPPQGTATPIQIAAFGAYQTQLAAYNAAVQALQDWRTGLANSATTNCQTIGTVVVAPNVPTFWHGTAWDSHLFFDADGTSQAGINDFALVPNGYVGPPFAFAPADSTLEPVAFAPPPIVTGGGPYQVDLEGRITLSATIPPTSGQILFAWDLDNNGSFETPGQSVTFIAPKGFLGVLTVAVRACDIHNACTSDQALIHVGPLASGNGTVPGGGGVGATPELDSVVLFASGLTSLAGYALLRRRGRRR